MYVWHCVSTLGWQKFDLCNGIYPWKVNHHSTFVNLSWHPSVFGVWHRWLPHFFLIWLKIKRHWTGATCPSVVTPGSSMLLLTVQPLKQVKCFERYLKGPSLVLCYFWATSTVHVCPMPLSEGSMTSMYADDNLLGTPIHHPENCDDIRRDINWCHPWMHKHQYISFNTRGSNPSKCKYLGCFGKNLISWADHIEHNNYVTKPGNFMPGLTQVQCSVSMSPAYIHA